MAWPATVSPHQAASAAQYNGVVLAIQTWQGDVSAGGYKLTNCGGITLAANGVLDVSAGGSNIKGALAIAADPVPLTVSTAGGVSLQLYTGGGAANPQLRSSSGGVVISSQAASITRAVRIVAIEGQEEFLLASSGRLRIAGSLDIDTDVVAAGKVQAATLNITNPANITLGANWVTWTPTLTPDAAMTLGAISFADAQYLRVGALLFFKLNCTFTVGGTPGTFVGISVPVPVVGAPSGLAGIFTQTPTTAFMTAAVARSDLTYGVVLRCGQNLFTAGVYTVYISGFYRCA